MTEIDSFQFCPLFPLSTSVMQKTFHRVVIIANNLALEKLNTTQLQLKRRQLSY